MNTWLFNNNDQTFGPLCGSEAHDFVVAHPLAYAWKPSFTHWMPVSSISDFSNIIPAPTPPVTIPPELVAAFYEKDKAVVDQLSLLDKRLRLTNQSILEFDKEIGHYKKLTQSCNMEMQQMLDNIESQYARLKQNLESMSSDALAGKAEHAELSSEFNQDPDLTEPGTIAPAPKRARAKSVKAPSIASAVSMQKQSAASHKEMTTAELKTTEHTPVTGEISGSNLAVDTMAEIAMEEVVSPKVSPLSVVEKNVEHTATANQFSSPKQTSFKKVEYSENISDEDISLSSKMRRVQMGDVSAISFDKEPVNKDYSGDFDHILEGEYADDGIIGSRINKTETEEVKVDTATEVEVEVEVEVESDAAEDDGKKKRRRRRR